MANKMTIDDLIKKIYKRKYQSVWTACLGPNQSGKTDWNLLQLEKIHALGLGDFFGSNMPDLDSTFPIEFIEDFPTLKKRCQMLNPNPDKYGIKRYFFFGSEMGDWAPKDQPWLNVKLIKELQLVRKYGLSMLGDAISRIDSRILSPNHFHGVFEKISKSKPQSAVYYDWFNGRKVKIHNIPRTKIGFNTWYSAHFYMSPQLEGARIPLSPEHEIVKKYLECGSWKDADIHPQAGKRAIAKVLDHHFRHCLHDLPQETEVPEETTT